MIVNNNIGHRARTRCSCENLFFFSPASCHGNVTVLNVLSASVTPSEHFDPCRKDYAFDRKMNHTFQNCHNVLYLHAKFGTDETTRADCR